jgi:hypothetical protein
LVHWRADEKRLRKNLCDTLGLIVARDDLRRLPGLLRIGEWRFSPSTGCPVWLACAPTGMALAEHFRQAAVISSCPSIVLLLTRSAWGIEAERYAPKNRFLVATLDEAISLNENGWVEAADWDERLGGFTEAAGISVSGGFRAKKKNEKLAQAGATAAKLKAELRQRFRSAKKKLLDTGVLLPAPEVQEIAWACGVHPSTAGRWLKGEYKERDKELALLWKHIGDREYIRSYRE